jgi:REP element-mobilizing transposase RayT
VSLYRGRYRIESARWPAWDYGAPGWYFVTICTKGPFLGEIFRAGTMWLSEAGQVVAQEWARTALIRQRVRLDAWVVMPDHFHGIVGIIEGPRETDWSGETVGVETPRRGVSTGWRSGCLGAIVGQFKSVCTKRIRRAGHCDFAWQARYHDRVIRSERELANVRRYITENPQRWAARSTSLHAG